MKKIIMYFSRGLDWISEVVNLSGKKSVPGSGKGLAPAFSKESAEEKNPKQLLKHVKIHSNGFAAEAIQHFRICILNCLKNTYLQFAFSEENFSSENAEKQLVIASNVVAVVLCDTFTNHNSCYGMRREILLLKNRAFSIYVSYCEFSSRANVGIKIQ